MEYPSDLHRNSRSCFAWLGRRSKKPHFLTFCFVVVTEQELCTVATLERIASGLNSLRRGKGTKCFAVCFLRERSFETSSDLKESHSLVSKAGC